MCSDAVETQPQSRSQRQRQLPSHLSDSLITEAIGTSHLTSDFSSERFKNELYYSTLDNIVKEMKTRFSDVNLTLMKSIDSLHPRSQHFLETDLLKELLKQYQVPLDGLEEQVLTFKRYLEKLPFCRDTNNLCNLLRSCYQLKQHFRRLKRPSTLL